MNRSSCEKETEILEAVRHGGLGPDLATHAETCAICADTMAVSELFQADRPAAPTLLDSDFLWWKSQLVRKQMTVERATRSIELVKKVSYVGAATEGVWAVFAPGHLSSILNILSRPEIWPNGALGQSAMFLGIAALVFTLLGSLYLVRPEK